MNIAKRLKSKLLWFIIVANLVGVNDSALARVVLFPTSEIVNTEIECNNPASAILQLSSNLDHYPPFIARVDDSDVPLDKMPNESNKKKFTFKDITIGVAIQEICDAFNVEFSIDAEGVVVLLNKKTIKKYTRFYTLDENLKQLWVEISESSFKKFGCDLIVEKYQGREKHPQLHFAITGLTETHEFFRVYVRIRKNGHKLVRE